MKIFLNREPDGSVTITNTHDGEFPDAECSNVMFQHTTQGYEWILSSYQYAGTLHPNGKRYVTADFGDPVNEEAEADETLYLAWATGGDMLGSGHMASVTRKEAAEKGWPLMSGYTNGPPIPSRIQTEANPFADILDDNGCLKPLGHEPTSAEQDRAAAALRWSRERHAELSHPEIPEYVPAPGPDPYDYAADAAARRAAEGL